MTISPRPIPMIRIRRSYLLLLPLLGAMACGSDGTTSSGRSFLDGTDTDPEIGIVVNSTGRAVTLFRLGAPSPTHQIPLGTSSTITPTGLSIRGRRAAVPLGNAASVALLDLAGERIERIFTFPSGNSTGSAFVDDTTILAANLTTNEVGKITLGQSADAIDRRVRVAPAPTAIVPAGSRALVISGNLDANFAPLGEGVVTAIDPATMTVIDSVFTGGHNPTAAALGPDGLLYVVNTEDYVSDGSVAVIDPATLELERVVPGFGAGPGSIHIDRSGLAYISSFSAGTLVWNTHTGAFVRGPDHPVCAPDDGQPGHPCRGAADATTSTNGTLYQVFFGSASQGLAPYVFVYAPGTFTLADSIAVGVGPIAIEIRSFRE